jgi:hypothetical protein
MKYQVLSAKSKDGDDSGKIIKSKKEPTQEIEAN